MKGIFWNCNGFADPKKYKFLSDLTKEQNLDFIALSETGRASFPQSTLNNICAGRDFIWHCMAPRGRSGGMILGVNLLFLDIGEIEEGDFFIRFKLRQRADDFKFNLISVYGPAQSDLKGHFLSELVRVCSKETIPTVVGGDFNILRNPQEKNNDNFNDRWPFLFNAVIDTLNLRELESSGRSFTWANHLQNQTFEKLDRILVSTEFETKFPLSTVSILTREISDHTPLLYNSGGASAAYQPQFKFELGWLRRDGFSDIVKEVWQGVSIEGTPLERWQRKIRRLRQFLRGWAKNITGAYKKEKKELLDKLDTLDKKAEHTILNEFELNVKHVLNDRLAELLREEEIKWYQRAKVKHLLEGDANTKYYHLLANGRHRKTRIFQLQDGNEVITGDAQLKEHITKYFKTLFGPSQTSSIFLDESQVDDIRQVSAEENESLTADFTEEEIKCAIFQMKHNTAPGPDGFPPEFYQAFWTIIKDDLLALFSDFQQGSLPLNSLNFGTIILLPKQKDVRTIQQYRPICLLNVSFKIFTKVATNRLTSVAQKVIKPTQTAFLPGRNIMEGAIILHETLHELHTKKQDGVIFKIDFEKAYDKVRWSFLQQTLRMKGFSHKWCSWVEKFTQGGNVSIKVNDQVGNYFQSKKGLRQGDPMSPVLFNIVVDMLAILIARAKNADRVEGVIPHLIQDGLSILQYADDTVIFMSHDVAKAINMKLILTTFEQLSGLKINFHKSEIFCFGRAKENEAFYSQLFGCKIGSFPFRYLGLPMHTRKLNNKDWQEIKNRIEKKLGGWKGKLLTAGGRLVLINSVLSSLPMFMLSFFEIPKGVLEKIDCYRSRFYWQNDQHKKKYRLAKWTVMCQPKIQGGLGIPNLEIQNKCLLSKWLFKLLNEDGLWQELIRNKYLKEKPLGCCQKRATDSHFWKGLMSIKDTFLGLGSFKIKDGSQTRFWCDTWLGNKPLKDRFPSLFNIVRRKNDSVAKVLSSSPLNISFRRNLVGANLSRWNRVLASIQEVLLQDGGDSFVWSLQASGNFTVKSMYAALISNGIRVSQDIWQIKVPSKIKIFLWYLKKGVILTKDNLARRNWHGDLKCAFCHQPESIQHLFFDCYIAKFLWRAVHILFGISTPSNLVELFQQWSKGGNKKQNTLLLTTAAALFWTVWLTRNELVFDNYGPKSFLQVLFRGTHWLRQWAKLQRHEDLRSQLIAASQHLESSALQFFSSNGWLSARHIGL